MSNQQDIPINEMTTPERPKAPWSKDEGVKLFEKSESEGHRKLTLKCQQCGLEYSVMTWRDEPVQKLSSRFLYCPECGSKDSANVIKLDHEIGRIYDAHINE